MRVNLSLMQEHLFVCFGRAAFTLQDMQRQQAPEQNRQLIKADSNYCVNKLRLIQSVLCYSTLVTETGTFNSNGLTL